jgi:hypothetical protein
MKNIYTILNNFIIQSRSGDLKTSAYPKDWQDLKLKVSFGMGMPARVPWISLLAPEMATSNGIYPYVLTRSEKYLSIRAFNDKMKREAYEKQKGICTKCKEHFELEGMEADHITPWHEGGKTNAENCQMLCKECNRRKSGK